MHVIYIAGKYQGRTHDGRSYAEIERNILAARDVAIEVWRRGAVALCPHLNTMHFELDCDADAEVFYRGDEELVRRSDALMMVAGWQDSRGAQAERNLALQLGKPVFEDLGKLSAWLSRGSTIEGIYQLPRPVGPFA